MPNLSEIWDLLVGLKETAESGFRRVELRLDAVESQISDMRSDIHRMERRLVRSDDRLSCFEDLNVSPRLDDHEQRILKLEQSRA